MNQITLMSIVLFLSLSTTIIIVSSTKQKYPSVSSAWCLPGYSQTPTDASTILIAKNASQVDNWEISHADMSYGGDYGPIRNKRIVSIGYMYNQVLSYDPGQMEMDLRLRTLNENVDYEDFHLHFTKDTQYIVADTSKGSWTSFYGNPWTFGYTNGPNHAGFSVYVGTPWNINPWQYSKSGGAVFLLSFEKFYSITLSIDSTKVVCSYCTLMVEYVSSVTLPRRRASEWSVLNTVVDRTNGLRQSGAISWIPPTNWQIATLSDGSGVSYGGGQFFGNSLMSNGGVAYAVRLTWRNGTGLGPILNDVKMNQWIIVNKNQTKNQTIPGWDAANDRNGDGYIDDFEYKSLINPSATARMRHESRVIPLGQMWSQKSSFCRTNLWNPIIRRYIADWLTSAWKKSGQQGAYNDDALSMLGPGQFTIRYGGNLAEFPSAPVQSNEAVIPYRNQFVLLLAEISNRSASNYISGNIGGVNVFLSNSTRMLLNGFGIFLQEAYLTAGIGLTGYFGIQKMWDTAAYAALGKRSLIQGQVWNGAAQLLSKASRTNWERDLGTLLALFYIINVPNSTAFHAWGNGWNYGSGNTQTYNYYKVGVPMNIAYQPTAMMSIDIGSPITSTSDLSPLLKNTLNNREFMSYEMTTVHPPNGYTVIGDTTSSILQHPEISPTGKLKVIPSLVYYLSRRVDHPQIPHTPLSCVLAREYTKGLILYRTDVYGASKAFLLSNITVRLPIWPDAVYRRVYYNGSLGPIASSVTLGGYEGAIFLKIQLTSDPTASPSTTPSAPPLSFSPSRPSRAPVSARPTVFPSLSPSVHPSSKPSLKPSSTPTKQPTSLPSRGPSFSPSSRPSYSPTRRPLTVAPSSLPITKTPTSKPSKVPSQRPTTRPSSNKPTSRPTSPTSRPQSSSPTNKPSSKFPTSRPATKKLV